MHIEGNIQVVASDRDTDRRGTDSVRAKIAMNAPQVHSEMSRNSQRPCELKGFIDPCNRPANCHCRLVDIAAE